MRVPVVVAALLLISAPASAGTAEDPEITDPADDQTYFGVVPVMQPPAGVTVGLNSDLQAAWIEDLGDALLFTTRVQGTGAPTTTSSSMYTFSFSVEGQNYVATVHMGAGAPVGSGTATAGGVATEATSASSLVTATVPKAAIGDPQPGATVADFFVTVEGRLLDAVEDFTVDRAPDSGFGRGFVLPGPEGATAPVYIDVETDELAIGNATEMETDALVQYNWTSPAAVGFRVVVNATAGDLVINITGPGWRPGGPGANGTDGAVYSCECNGSVDEQVPADDVRGVCVNEAVEVVPCEFTVKLELRAFVGAWSITSSAPAATEDELAGNATGNAPGNTTDLQDTPSAESPLPVGLAMLAVAAAARRRR